jgi:hypothetical protein
MYLAFRAYYVKGMIAIAGAQFFTGNDLFGFCSAVPGDVAYETKWGQCLGYIIGVVDTSRFGTSRICLSSQVTTGQVRDVAIHYLQINPGKRHLPADLLVGAALAEAFPCR